MPTRIEANEEMRVHFDDAWQLIDFSLIGLDEPPLIVYDGADNIRPPEFLPWGRFAIRTNNSPIAAHGVNGVKLYRTVGFVFVQLFVPTNLRINSATILQVQEYLGSVAVKVFRGKSTPSGVIFRSAQANEIGIVQKEYQVNVQAEFEYDERS